MPRIFTSLWILVLAISVSTGLPGAGAIHYVPAISLPEVNEIVTLDRHFRRVNEVIGTIDVIKYSNPVPIFEQSPAACACRKLQYCKDLQMVLLSQASY